MSIELHSQHWLIGKPSVFQHTPLPVLELTGGNRFQTTSKSIKTALAISCFQKHPTAPKHDRSACTLCAELLVRELFFQESAPTVKRTVYKHIEHVFALQKLPEMQASSQVMRLRSACWQGPPPLRFLTNKAKP